MRNLLRKALVIILLICMCVNQPVAAMGAGLTSSAQEQSVVMDSKEEEGGEAAGQDTEEAKAAQDAAEQDTEENGKETTEKTAEETEAGETSEREAAGASSEEITEETSKETADTASEGTTEETTEEESDGTKKTTEAAETGETSEDPSGETETGEETAELPASLNPAAALEIPQASVSAINNSLNMPTSTYQTMVLQGASGYGQRINEGGLVTMMASNEAIQQDIDTNHKDYTSFTPSMTANSQAVLSTYDGSVASSVFFANSDTIASAGVFGDSYNLPNITDGRVYSLTDSMENNLSCLYTNVGRYYDRSAGKSYGIDVKATLVSFTKKNKNSNSVQNAIAAGLLGSNGGAFFAFTKINIGVLTLFCDSVKVRYEYYIHGTQTPISIKGFSKFEDIDGQQGIEFDSAADYFYAISGAENYLGVSKSVYTQGNRAYVYALSGAAYDSGDQHAVYALFSGSQMTLRYTFAQCSRSDDGGKKNNNKLKQYKAPYDSSTQHHYTNNFSGGYMAFFAESPALPTPEIGKYVFNGADLGSETVSPTLSAENVLTDAGDIYTYRVRTVCPYTDASRQYYSSWVVEDAVSPYVNVVDAVVYEGDGQKSGNFTITQSAQADGSTLVRAQAVNTREQSFYEKNWYDLYITVRVKTAAELSAANLNFASLYAGSGSHAGRYLIYNQATLTANAVYRSNQTTTVVPQSVKVRKQNEDGEGVSDITFGIFANPDADVSRDTPLATAKTGEDGIAVFRMESFYTLAGKSGPYYIREISRGKYENVFRLDTDWSYAFSADSGNDRIYPPSPSDGENVLTDEYKEFEPSSLKLQKKNSDTGSLLKGAVFTLYQWSESAGDYEKLSELAEKTDGEDIYYTNEEAVRASEDNRGKFMVTEEKAPEGCYLSGQKWYFETTDASQEDIINLEYVFTTSGGKQKYQKSVLVYANDLQKGRIVIEKTNEDAEPVEGAVFTVEAAEDIYAPWQSEEEEPLLRKGTVCAELTTDSEGKATSGKLYIGSYLVKETRGAAGHLVSDEVYTVAFAYPDDDTTETVTETLSIGNRKMKPSFAVAKKADRTLNEAGEAVAFDEEAGRYTEEKVPGIYQANETVRYAITVTNTGNTDLYQLALTEDVSMENEDGQRLKDYIVPESAAFVIPEDGQGVTAAGESVVLSRDRDAENVLHISKLATGDSITVTYTVTVSAEAANVCGLINHVSGTSYYDNDWDEEKRELLPVDTDTLVDASGENLTEDTDRIHIPGIPDDKVVKLADRTTGCAVSDGECSGTRVPGVYQAGEEVVYTIWVKNTGTANLKNITVTDVMSAELSAAVVSGSAAFVLDEEAETILSAYGKELSIKKLDASRVKLCVNDADGEDRLTPGDYVTLSYKVKLKKDIANLYDLNNTVKLTAFYFGGEQDLGLPEITDEDKIAVPGDPSLSVAKLANHTAGVVLENGRYQNARITGDYQNGEEAVYTITLTNTGTANLYHIKLKDAMEQRLRSALKENSLAFKGGTYVSAQGEQITAELSDQEVLLLDHLKAGDSVEVVCSGVVSDTAGELYALENRVYATANYRKGDEQGLIAADEAEESRKKTYSVVYHANDGQETTTTDTETPASAGREITVNGNPFTRDGYQFLGWNTKADGSGDSYAPGAGYAIPEKDTHFYAMWKKKNAVKWTSHQYHLYYHSNQKDEVMESDSETACIAGTVVTIDEPGFTCPGYHFTGWTADALGKEAVLSPGDSYEMPDKDVHLYAQWERDEKVTLTYHSNNGEGETVVDFESPCKTGTEIRIKACPFEKTDEVFVGWSTDPAADKAQIQPDESCKLEENTDLYAVWEPDEGGADEMTYRLTYHGNNGSEDSCLDSETPCAAGTQIQTDENRFAREGYVFAGWNTKPDGTGKAFTPSDAFTMKGRDVHLYAQWEKIEKHTLTYCSNFPEDGMEEERARDGETPCATGESVSLNGNPFSCSGYLFVGWGLDKKETTRLLEPGDGFVLTEDTTLYAQWVEEDDLYTLRYHSNTDEGQYETDTVSASPAGVKKTLMENTFSNPGYRFVGWSLDKDADADSGDLLEPGQQFTQPEKDVTLYAIWAEAEVRHVYYDANIADDPNGQSRIEDGETPCTAGEMVTLDSCSFVYEGYRFAGWILGVSQAEDGTVLYPGCAYQADEDVTFYAKWEKEPTTSYSELSGLFENESEFQKKEYTGERAFDIRTEDITAQSVEGYTPIPVTALMVDRDRINIPGEPELKVAKAADKTKGITLKNGRYKGTRKYGTYQKGDTVQFYLTVTNSGTASAYQVAIRENPSAELKKWTKAVGFTVKEGATLITENGNTATVTKCTARRLVIDRLQAGDQVTVCYERKVTKAAEKDSTLKNTVKVTGKDADGAELAGTKEMKDTDKIRLKGTGDDGGSGGETDASPTGTNPKTGDDAPLAAYLLAAGASLLALAGYRRRKHKHGSRN